MAETTADVRRDIELTRERMSNTIAELERKLNVTQVVRDHPWPAIALAAGAGFLLSGSGADVKAAGAAASTVAATKGASSRLGPLLDDLVAKVLGGVQEALESRADELVDELKRAIGAPEARGGRTAYAADTHRTHEPTSHVGGAPRYDAPTAHAPTRGFGHDTMRGDGMGEQGVAPVGAVAGVPPRTATRSESPITGEQWTPAEQGPNGPPTRAD